MMMWELVDGRWNDTSSRSHTVFQVAVTRYGTLDGESQPR